MKISWMVACEQVVMMSDGRPYAMGIFMKPIPWMPPGIQIPVAVLWMGDMDPSDVAPRKLTLRIISPDGVVAGKAETQIQANPTPGKVARHAGLLAGLVGIAAPGDYELQLVLDGQPMDDAPTWTLRFREVGKKPKATGGPPSGPPTPPPTEPPPIPPSATGGPGAPSK